MAQPDKYDHAPSTMVEHVGTPGHYWSAPLIVDVANTVLGLGAITYHDFVDEYGNRKRRIAYKDEETCRFASTHLVPDNTHAALLLWQEHGVSIDSTEEEYTKARKNYCQVVLDSPQVRDEMITEAKKAMQSRK